MFEVNLGKGEIIMPKTIQSTRFSKKGRSQIRQFKAKDHPEYLSISNGMHLGYKRTKNGSKWYARYLGALIGDEREYVKFTLGSADDYAECDGVNVLSLGEAQHKMHELKKALVSKVYHEDKPTMRFKQVMQLYWKDYCSRNGDRINDSHKWYIEQLNEIEIPIRVQQNGPKPFKLGDVQVDRLTFEDLESIKTKIAQTPRKHAYTKVKVDRNEALRKRKSTSNRFVVIIKAILNFGYRHKRTTHIKNNAEWINFKKYPNIDKARQDWWDRDQCQAWLNHCNNKSLRDLFVGAISCGFRLGEQSMLLVGDVDLSSDTPSVHVRSEIAKTKKSRNVIIPTQFVPFFTTLIGRRDKDDLLFKRDFGDRSIKEWRKNSHNAGFNSVTKSAGLPRMVWHSLRHTYASQLVQKGVKLKTVANQLGHATTYYVEKWYGHLCDLDTLNEVNKLEEYHNIIKDEAEVVKVSSAKSSHKPVYRDGRQRNARKNFPIYSVPKNADELLDLQNDPRYQELVKMRVQGTAKRGVGATIHKKHRQGEL